MTANELDLVILKTLINNKKHALDFSNDNEAKLFSPEVWNFANLVTGYVKTYKELPTLRVLLEKLSKGKSNDKLIENTKNIWNQIEKISYNESDFKHDLEKLKHRFVEKQVLSAKDAFSKFESGSVDAVKAVIELQKTIQNIKSVDQNKTYERKTLKDALPGFVEKFNAKRNNPDLDIGVKTGYSFFDYATNGLKPADFVIIAGESGFGKSLLLNNMGVQTWLQSNTLDTMDNFAPGKNVVYFSLEMPYEDCFNRLLSRLSGVPSRKIENAKVNKEEFEKIKKALDFINIYPYNFEIIDIADARACDLDVIINDIQYNIDAIFIDYLGIMKPNESKEDQDWLKQGIISYEVRGLARKYKLPIFTAVQLNRKNNKEGADNIGLHRLARSATIATHATHVVQIESQKEDSFKNDPLLNVHIIKNRKGPKGKFSLYKNLACASLIDKLIENSDDELNSIFTDMDDISEYLEELNL